MRLKGFLGIIPNKSCLLKSLLTTPNIILMNPFFAGIFAIDILYERADTNSLAISDKVIHIHVAFGGKKQIQTHPYSRTNHKLVIRAATTNAIMLFFPQNHLLDLGPYHFHSDRSNPQHEIYCIPLETISLVHINPFNDSLLLFLPPAFRRIREGYVFTGVRPSIEGGGGGGTLVQVLSRRVPQLLVPGPFCLTVRGRAGCTPGQQLGVTLWSGRGTPPQLSWGHPSPLPPPEQDGCAAWAVCLFLVGS